MPTYKTFKRSARNWEEFSTARKITVDTGLTYEEVNGCIVTVTVREYHPPRGRKGGTP